MTRREGYDLIRARQVAAERARQHRQEQGQAAAQVRERRAQRLARPQALDPSCTVGACSGDRVGVRALRFEQRAEGGAFTATFPACARHLRVPYDQLVREGLPGGYVPKGLASWECTSDQVFEAASLADAGARLAELEDQLPVFAARLTRLENRLRVGPASSTRERTDLWYALIALRHDIHPYIKIANCYFDDLLACESADRWADWPARLDVTGSAT